MISLWPKVERHELYRFTKFMWSSNFLFNFSKFA